MGLFSFAKSIGKKLFGVGDDPAEKIKEHIQEDNPGVEDLQVVYQDGAVKIAGNASNEAMEKAILMAGNHRGRRSGRDRSRRGRANEHFTRFKKATPCGKSPRSTSVTEIATRRFSKPIAR